ncbi:MAG: c-type cytochrome [Rhizobacter sp.]|jgi:mono/diheme cytochrome c family protein
MRTTTTAVLSSLIALNACAPLASGAPDAAASQPKQVAPDAATAPPAQSTPKTPAAPLYTVVDGYKVDTNTMKGFRTWRSAACDRCHGANQEGLVGPSLIESFKNLTKEQVVTTVTNGRLEKGMPSFSASPSVMDNIDHLYAYLKGRSDGAITRAKVEEIQ